MKQLLLIALLSTTLLTGCLDWNLNIKVNSDGSGTITETTSIPITSTMAEVDNTFVIDSIKKMATERFGEVEVVDYNQTNQHGCMVRQVHYSFKKINNVYMNLMGNDIPKEQYSYRFAFNNTTQTLSIIADSMRFNSVKQGMEGDDNNAPSKETKKMALNMVKGFRFHLSITTEKPILRTNALFKKENTVELIKCDLYEFTKLSYNNKKFRKAMKDMSSTPTKEQIALMKKYNFIIETQNVVDVTF